MKGTAWFIIPKILCMLQYKHCKGLKFLTNILYKVIRDRKTKADSESDTSIYTKEQYWLNHLIPSSHNRTLQCQTQNFITVCFFSLHGCAALRWTCSIAGITNILNHGHYEYRNTTAVKRHAVYVNSSLSTSGKIRLRASNCHSGYYRQLTTSQSTFQSVIFRFDTEQSCRRIQTNWRICCLHIQCSSTWSKSYSEV
jgi:hypothetical protein